MNLLTSYSWIKSFLKTDASAEVFAREMSLVGNGVEHVHPSDALFYRVVVGHVLEVHVHPNADRLRVVKVDVGGSAPLQIVCGGENLAVRQWVPVALAGAKVKWHGEEVMEIKETEMRSVKSEGMICAGGEVGYEKLEVGEKNIWDLTSILKEPKAGMPLAAALGVLGDVVFDIEVTTNRPDAMSIVGQAREAAALGLGVFDDFMRRPPALLSDVREEKVFTLKVDEQKLCPRYMAAVMDVVVATSPWWIVERLLSAGAKPINNVVDVTNYVRLELGQPLHAFDYDTLAGKEIVVRRARAGEVFAALDGSSYHLTEDMLVIADGEKAAAVAGVMGGAESGTTEATKTIVLEAAAFDDVAVRKTARALNLSSDSQVLFEKGLSAELPAFGLARAIELLTMVAGARLVSPIQDIRSSSYARTTFPFDPARVNGLIGVDVPVDFQINTLEALGFSLQETSSIYDATVPFWREHDIEGPVDFTEEVARFYGYHNLPTVLPSGEIPRRAKDALLEVERDMQDLFAGAGWTETYANSFVSMLDMKAAKMKDVPVLQLANPLSVEERVMRPSLVPTMCKTIATNEGWGGVERLFEVARVYLPRAGDLPEERSMLLVAMTEGASEEDRFRNIKGALDRLAAAYHFTYRLDRNEVPSWLHPGRAARILVHDVPVAVLGEVNPEVLASFGLRAIPSFLEIDLAALQPHLKPNPTYQEIPAYPEVRRDLAVVLDEKIEYEKLEETVKAADALVSDVWLFDIFRGESLGEAKKSLAVHVSFSARERTLTSEEADAAMVLIRSALEQKLGATIRESGIL